MEFTERHRKVLYDFYHMDQQALLDLVQAGLIEFPGPKPAGICTNISKPIHYRKGFETAKEAG